MTASERFIEIEIISFMPVGPHSSCWCTDPVNLDSNLANDGGSLATARTTSSVTGMVDHQRHKERRWPALSQTCGYNGTVGYNVTLEDDCGTARRPVVFRPDHRRDAAMLQYQAVNRTT